MKKLIKLYTNPNVSRFNYKILNREYDDPIEEYIVNACKSLEIVDYIKFEGYTINSDESTIDRNKYIRTRRKSKKDKHLRFRHISDSRIIEMVLSFRVEYKGQEKLISKSIIIPIADEDGYYYINGTKYFLMYQLVDSSTYNTSDAINLKSLMAIVTKREVARYKNTEGEEFDIPIYKVRVYNKYIDALAFYFAAKGVKETLDFFNVSYIIGFTDEPNADNAYNFKINKTLFLTVNKNFFDNHIYVKSVVGMILQLTTNRLSIDKIYSQNYWIEKLGSNSNTKKYNHFEKGVSSIVYFERLFDKNTKKVLRITEENKKDIYCVTRWLIQNYSELRKKDNLDLKHKRLRCNEYIAFLLTRAFSERVNRITGSKLPTDKKVALDKICEIFKFPGDILIKHLHQSGLLRYDDHVNDMDIFSKLKYTIKGPNSLGGGNDRKISTPYRSAPISFLGSIDPNVCGNSDPGTSGVLTPFVKTDGLYFSDKLEPEQFKFDFDKLILEKKKADGLDVIELPDKIDIYYKCVAKQVELLKDVNIIRTSDKCIIRIY